MQNLGSIIQKAESSRMQLWLLNRMINGAVRFNKPHGFRVAKISATQVQTSAPYHTKNFNHVRSIHACAIATVGELSAGLLLMYHFSPKQYRVILSNLTIDYHYQAKKDIIATAIFSEEHKKIILDALAHAPKTTHTVVTEIKDGDAKLVATVKSTWQIKKWDEVKTKL